MYKKETGHTFMGDMFNGLSPGDRLLKDGIYRYVKNSLECYDLHPLFIRHLAKEVESGKDSFDLAMQYYISPERIDHEVGFYNSRKSYAMKYYKGPIRRMEKLKREKEREERFELAQLKQQSLELLNKHYVNENTKLKSALNKLTAERNVK